MAIWGFIFLNDNIHIVSGSLDGAMRKWNCNTGLVVGEPWKGEGGKIHALVLSPDGKIIACGRGDGSVQRWTTDGEMIEGVWTGHSEWVRSLAWSPSGSHIASGSEDGTILIRRADNGGGRCGAHQHGADWGVESCIFTLWRENCIRRVQQINLHLGYENRQARRRPNHKHGELLCDVGGVVVRQR
jgi:WD40 repeat protein